LPVTIANLLKAQIVVIRGAICVLVAISILIAGSITRSLTAAAVTVQEVAGNAAQATDAAEQPDVGAKQGLQVVGQNKEAINALAAEVNGASNVIHRLESDSQSIGSVLDVIGLL